MKIMEAGSRPTKLASSDWFTGTVWQDPIVEAPEPAYFFKHWFTPQALFRPLSKQIPNYSKRPNK